jgi:5-methylcytosine-specific restriction endonuclease McrBC GTP-binding regulatory subunit McrB
MGKAGNIEYSFCPQVFTEAYITAWQNPYTTIYLVIEEINRGNCAQIFGDLFQLLDRKNGYSEYPIKADKDLADYIEKKLGKGHEGIAQRELRLPPNLTILATMNTSDQSLFPMDSAFKRRWDWEYVQIEPSHPESQFKINISGKTYNWADFLTEVNKRITVLTDSEDKMLGNFFIKDNINEEEFKSKVMFYLWSEVCKDYVHADTFFRSSKVIDGKEVQEEFTFSQLYESNASETLEGFMKFLGILEFVEKPEDYLEDDTTDEETNETDDTNI